MGGGDLNMKKSWHPLLLKNQERVWLEEKKALEEKKKLDQLRKEKEEERQLQELQRLQEEQTGRKRTEKLEWMYTTPATGSSQNPNDLEDYLLGKKRVDKILIADENEKLGAAHKSFIAVQNANSARDTAVKVREDPLFAIKQQEAAAYEALKSNPLRLRELQERNGIKPKKDKKREKKEKRRREGRGRADSPRSEYDDGHIHYHRSRRSPSPRDHRSRSPYRPRSRYDDEYDRRNPDYSRRARSRSRSVDSHYRRRDRSRSYERRGTDSRRSGPWARSDESDSPDGYRGDRDRRGRGSVRSRERSDRYRQDDGPKRRRSQSPPDHNTHFIKRTRISPPPSRPPNASISSAAEDRAARLASMSSNATSLESDRKERLTALLEKEKAELEAEERLRAKSKGMGGFLNHEQKKVFSGQGGLEERLRRGRAGLVSVVD
ncbi:hypothetical protein EW146_g2040 [Bondarzewia mesenterica]|uniref:CBF1-interacting co-repressor CIR N-terminal domain-containing protein n=1 Tax=Bondarzewia mesenterica TaxID=1095465 RepID=A0A4S4M3C8_9AGAM|nr:hypothetical protein EW146_g2040 [Bondarzewia mesenterica]